MMTEASRVDLTNCDREPITFREASSPMGA